MSVDVIGTSLGQPPPDVDSTLATAEIPRSKLGAARHARLTDAERELYVWILRRFATHGRPSSKEMRTATERLGIDPKDALETFAREDLVHRGADGEISVAYPFSGRPTAHRVCFPNGHEVDAMCAIDALGVAPMLGLPIEITSRDPVSAAEVWVRLDPGDAARWEPEQAVVLAGSACCDGPSFGGCCDVLNFFESAQNAEQYLREHDQVRGLPISIPTASQLGSTVFGDIFKEA